MITVKFWGTRGSIPTGHDNDAYRASLIDALTGAGPGDISSEKAAAAYIDRRIADGSLLRYGGETTCAEFRNSGGGRVIIDFGSGARKLGAQAMAERERWNPLHFSVLMTHMHWDHVQGFPFFAPAFHPDATFSIRGGHGGRTLEQALFAQMDEPFFPVPRAAMQAKFEFSDCAADESFEMEGFRITPHLLRHGGGSYGYRFDFEGNSVVFASDAEHEPNDITPDYDYVHWSKGADLLIFDGQYSLTDLVLHKEHWGHSSGLVAVDLAHLAKVPEILLTHHDPFATDNDIATIVGDTREYVDMLHAGGAEQVGIAAAYDGLEVTIG
ncbi:MAG: MBL fold metallo-hydrolase [Pseudomonadota bacterium]